MSSTHIVTDKNRSAVILANGELCSMDHLGQALEWGSFILALDGAADKAFDLQIKIDAVLGDFDSIQNLDEILAAQKLDVIDAPDQNKTDLEKGLSYLIGKGFSDSRILWASGKRSDHFIANLNAMANNSSNANLVLSDDYISVHPLKTGFKKWYPAKTGLSLIPFPKATDIRTKGLAYNLKNESLQLGGRIGSSNFSQTDGFVEIEYSSGFLFLMESELN